MNLGAPLRIGIISDTHGLLRPEILEVFKNVDHILHAGDVGDIAILHQLSKIAPVTAVRGNTDVSPECRKLPVCETISLASAEIFMHHGHLEEFNILPHGTNVLISGHTHAPRIFWRENVLVMNPGSAGPRRFSLPVSVGILTIYNKARSAEIIQLSI
ncbi:MAG: metallophosphoesterase family protein [Opitutales bacterium]|nr:metallophosphoesterase family protein [Opitutales bacterium]